MPLAEEMVQCPYNSYHIILKSRFSAHLCKCRRQYSGSDFTVCPFNATHNVLAPELQYHVENCPDRGKLDSHLYVVDDPVDEGESSYRTAANDIVLPPASEDWENEAPVTKSYLDVKEDVISKKPVLRFPVGKSKAQRRKFFEDEIRRFDNLRGPSTSSSTKDSVPSGRKPGVEKGNKETKSSVPPADEDTDEECTIIKNRGQGRAWLQDSP